MMLWIKACRLASRIKEETMHVRWKEVVAQCRQPYVMEMFTHPDEPEGTISRSQLQGKVSGQRNEHLLCLHCGVCHDHW